MDNPSNRIKELQEKLNQLLIKQEAFSREIAALQDALASLKQESEAAETQKAEEVTPGPAEEAKSVSAVSEPAAKTPKKETPPEATTTSKRLYRLQENKILGGVCSGIAAYSKMNVWLLRGIWILFSLLFCIGVLAYLILWMALPSSLEPTPVPEKVVRPVREKPVETARPQAEATKFPEPETITSVPKAGFNLEKYIGESLISKIGMAVLIIGAGIGVKYSIENDLISPIVRIILGYLLGVLLLLIGGRLKPKYETFSAVLVSGAMAILYFMTYAAYLFYGMLPQWLTFGFMVLFTVVTVFIALRYDRQIIAHLGLVGAYIIPFLLDEGDGEPVVLFSYIAIINLGILFIAFRKYWKPLYVFSFAMTWLIFCSWFLSSFEYAQEAGIASFFAFLFFLIYYITFLAYKFIKKEVFNALDVVLLLANSLIFYGLGYAIVADSPDGDSYLGLFTLGNAFLHGIVSFITYRFKLADKNIFHLVTGLVLIFITISIPVQLDGNWVTLLWIGEATLLFHIGRTRNAGLYESMAYPLLILFLLSLAQDWGELGIASRSGNVQDAYAPFFNPVFLTALMSSAALVYINHLFHSTPNAPEWVKEQSLNMVISIGLSAVLLTVLYFSFTTEISNYWNQEAVNYLEGGSSTRHKSDIESFKGIWLINFSLLFFAILGLINNLKIKSRFLGNAHLGLSELTLILFLTIGLFLLSELRDSYLNYESVQEGMGNGMYIGLRYFSFLLLAALLIIIHKSLKQEFMAIKADILFDVVLTVVIVWVVTSELLHWLDLAGVSNTYKLWVSILWGVYALLLIAAGIWKKKKHLRICAIVLFSITLLKLFFYDIAHLNTLSKTIVFVSLGILLLVVSYLYNRFKNVIAGEEGPES